MRLHVDTARPRSWLTRLVRWIRGNDDRLVEYCARCHNVTERGMYRLAVRHSQVVCTGPYTIDGNAHCLTLKAGWS